MSSESCPICSEKFDAAGAVRDHAWERHQGCHYCGEELPDDAAKEELYKHWLTAHPDDLRRVDQKQAESEVDAITFSDRLDNAGVGAAVTGLPRRYFLVAGGAATAGGIAGVGAYLNSREGGLFGDANTVDDYNYASFGSADADTRITYYGSYKCPFCATFSTGQLQDLIRDYVEPGDLEIVYRNLSYFNGRPFLGPDAPNAGNAGLAVYNNEPESYRAFHDYVFQNQPPESQRWATADRLTTFAEDAGVADPSVIGPAIEESRYRDALEATDSAARSAGVTGTPALLIDGTVASPGQGQVRQLIENAIANS